MKTPLTLPNAELILPRCFDYSLKKWISTDKRLLQHDYNISNQSLAPLAVEQHLLMAETEETNETAPLDHQTGFGAEHLQMTLKSGQLQPGPGLEPELELELLAMART
ncbi:unnamed protein product [Sphagnum jensenii]